MRRVEIKEIEIQNFKGIKSYRIPFFLETVISGRNATGKTTIFDALTWLLFNKDSLGNEKFAVRPLNPDGTTIDGVEIAVSALISVDGRVFELKKTQKQNWVKKRGSEEATFQGNQNTYEVDGYPKGEAEYKRMVAEIIDENLFKILTNPMHFPNLKWQEQRAMLMEFLKDETDAEIAKRLGGFEELLPELEKAPSTEDIRAKYAKALKVFKDRQKEIPVRIDELENSRVKVDVTALKAKKAEIVGIVSGMASDEEKAAKQYKSLQTIKDEIYTLKHKAHEIEQAIKDRDREAKATAEIENRKLEMKRQQAFSNVHIARQNIKLYESQIKQRERELNEIRERKLPDNFICPTCGKRYGEKRIASIKKQFEEEKNANYYFVNSQISELKAELAKEKIKEADGIAEVNRLAELEPIEAFEPEDVTKNMEWIAIKEQVKEKESALDEEDSLIWQLENYRSMRSSYEEEVAEINRELAKAEAMTAIDNRIEELRAELKDVGQKVADQEKMLYLLERFTSKKLDMMSEQINGKFDGVEWTLFEKQINGGVKETCVCTVNGVPYGSVNSGHKIVAGLQIIRAMQNHFGVCAPIFIDNAESINRENVPPMTNQMIYLVVTEGNLEVS